MGSPTISPPKSSQKELSLAEKRALLKQMLKKRAQPKEWPLSFEQQRLWYLDQLQGPSSTYNLRFGLYLKGALDKTLLERCLVEVVSRHESLRSSFHKGVKDPIQRVHPKFQPELPIIDLSGLPHPRDITSSLFAQGANKSFDLQQLPLFRLTLFQLGDNHHALLLTLHHIITDGLSMTIFVREMLTLYEAWHLGRTSPLKALPLQYPAYAKAQRERMHDGSMDAHLDWWRNHLKDAPALLNLPLDAPRPLQQTNKGGRYGFALETQVTQQLHEITRRSGATFFMAALTAFASWLSRYSGQTHIVVGTPTANRREKPHQPMIGFFVNTLAPCIDFGENPSFSEALAQVRQTTRQIFSHGEVPFDKIIQSLDLPRYPDHQPLVQVMLAVQNFEVAPIELPGLIAEAVPIETGTTKFEIAMQLDPTGEDLKGFVEFNCDLFTQETIQRMVGHFLNLLAEIPNRPNDPLSSLPMQTEAEQHRLLNALSRAQLALHVDVDAAKQLLDRWGQPVPEGVVGQLFVENKPTPYLLRQTRDGLEYQGYADRCITLNGYRLQLEHIERAIMEHPKVVEAVVTASQDQLVAWYVSNEQSDLRLDLPLPEYMQPTSMKKVPEIPRTASGAVDFDSLQTSDVSLLQAEDYVAPRNDVERQLAEILSEVLEVEQVGAYDNFFKLGGHSMLATQVVMGIFEVFDIEISLKEMFTDPTVEGLAKLVGKLSGQEIDTIECIERSQTLPLSFAQQRLWVLEQMMGPSATYNVPAAYQLEGPLNVALLERAILETIRRHEILRSHIEDRDGAAEQVVQPSLPWQLAIIEASLIERVIEPHLSHQFFLDKGPLFILNLVRITAQHHILLLNMHHIITDAWSVTLMINEVQQHYNAALRSEQVHLEPLPIQYADYAAWQRTKNQEDNLSWWQTALDGAPQVLDLPTVAPRDASSLSGALYAFDISSRDVGLNELARKCDATPFHLFAAAFGEVLGRTANTPELLLGTPFANRNRPELRQLIGFFVNPVVLRTQRDASHTVTSRIHHLREVALDAIAHGDLPFERLVEAVVTERDPTRSPLFQAMLSYSNAVPIKIGLDGLEAARLDRETGVTKYELTLHVFEDEQGSRCVLEYASNLFDVAQIKAMAGHIMNVLDSFIDNPSGIVSSIDILGHEERTRILKSFNQQRMQSSNQLVVDLFSRYQSERPAVEQDQDTVSYASLHALSNTIACHLLDHGIKPGDLVAIALPASYEMVATVWGVLKSGAAYVPLDPTYPHSRLQAMLEDARCPVLITEQDLVTELTPPAQTTILFVNQLEVRQTGITHQPDPHDPAYVIYTSGSTGKPKGVVITHGSLSHSTRARLHQYPSTPGGEKFLLLSSMSFDSSVAGFFGTLCSGGTLVLAQEPLKRQPDRLLQRLEQNRVTQLLCVPSLLKVLLDEMGEHSPEALKCAIVAGEPCPPDLVSRFAEQLPGATLYNEYGPTEGTVWASVYTCLPQDQGAVSIGKPIADTQIYILDRQLHPTPCRVPGMLMIGGDGLARGYLGRPSLTAQKWLPHPFGPAGARLYLTGDLASWREDGNIDFLGRSDHQVKIRGYRIEPGEIENVLKQQSGVHEAAIIVKEGAEPSLHGFVVGDSNPKNLRDTLRHLLPDHMVPTSIQPIEALPLTPNGKRDQQKLRSLIEVSSEHGRVSARTVTEQLIAGIWAETLDIKFKPGIDDHFFEQGGHSLSAIRLVAQIRKILSCDIPVDRLFQVPTIRGISEYLDTQQTEKGPELCRLDPRPEKLLLSFSQQRLVMLDRLIGPSSTYNLPGCFQLAGPLDLSVLETALHQLQLRHEILRTRIDERKGEPTVHFAHQPVDLQVIDLKGKVEILGEITANELARPFLLDGALLRLNIIRLEPQKHVLLMTMHHILADEWSLKVIAQDIEALYAAGIRGQVAQIPNLDIQYVDYAHWQREWLDEERCNKHRSYWRKQLEDLPPRLPLLTDRPYPARTSYHGDHVHFDIPNGQQLEAFARAQGVTPFVLLLSVYQLLLVRYSGSLDIAVGTPLAQRGREPLTAMIGLFLNTVVIRGRLKEDDSFTTFLQQTQTHFLDALAHGDLPFEQLVESLSPQRSLSHAPLFQVMFTVISRDDLNFKLPGVDLTALPPAFPTAKFELTLAIATNRDGWHANFEYNTDLFDRSTIERMAGHFNQLLDQIMANPNAEPLRYSLTNLPAKREPLLQWRNYPLDITHLAHILTRHEQVQDAAFYIQNDALTALFVGDLTTEELVAYCEANLPDYCIPDQFVRVAEIPRTEDGGIDPNDITVLAEGALVEAEPYVSPRTETEKTVAQILAEVVEIESVGVHDNFFKIGGHSLLATQVIMELFDAFELELSLKQVFENPTPEKLAAFIDRELRDEDHPETAPAFIQATVHEPGKAFPMSYAQKRFYVLHQIQPENPFYNVPIVARLKGPLALDALFKVFDVIVARHEILRTNFQIFESIPQQVIQEPYSMETPIDDLTHLPEHLREEEAMGRIDAFTMLTFDLAKDRLWRTKLLKIADQEHIFVSSLHHIIFDAWSIGVFVREVTALYQAFVAQNPSPLPELPIQYVDYAIWQRDWLKGTDLKQDALQRGAEEMSPEGQDRSKCQLSYWQKQLENLPHRIELPTDRPRPARPSYRGEHYHFELKDGGRLEAFAKAHGVTPFVLLLAIYQVLLAKYSGSRDIPVGTPINQRDHHHLTELIGLFLNTVVMRAQIGKGMSFTDLLAQVQGNFFDALGNGDLPFEQLVEAVRPQRSLSHAPLFQVMFTTVAIEGMSLNISDLDLSLIPPKFPTSKFELTLAVTTNHEDWHANFEYNSDLFDPTTIEGMAQHYNQLLQLVVAHPEKDPLAHELVGIPSPQAAITWQGYQIDLAHIVDILKAHESVTDAAAQVTDDSLIVYVVGDLASSELVSYCEAHLPDYSIPQHHVTLEKIPRTADGKLDTNALPAAESVALLDIKPYVAPRDEVEKTVARILAEVIEVAQVGIHDNFFKMGGHSLLATAVIMELFDAFDLEIPLNQIFENPTVARLATFIKSELSDQETTPATRSAIPALPRKPGQTFSLSYAQQRLYVLHQMNPDSPFYNVPIAVKLKGALNIGTLSQVFAKMIERHEVLRTNFQSIDNVPQQIIQDPFPMEIQTEDLTHLSPKASAETIKDRIEAFTLQPFDLATDLLWRTKLIKVGSEEHVFISTKHHIIFDAWSMGVFMREVATLYHEISTNQPVSLTSLPVQYADFAMWQREWFQGETLDKEIEFWKQQLTGAPPLLELPYDKLRPEVETVAGRNHSFEVDNSTRKQLEAIAQEADATLFMTMMTAFQCVMHWFSGHEDIVIGTDIANRGKVETRNMLGFFINQLALRSRLDRNATFRNHLARTRVDAHNAYENQNLPFETVVSALNPPRANHAPIFQVKFNLQYDPGSMDIDELVFEPILLERQTSKLDLTFSMTMTEQGLSGTAEYKTDLFQNSTIERLTQHFITALREITKNPDITYEDLTYALDQEARTLKKSQRKKPGKFKKSFRKK